MLFNSLTYFLFFGIVLGLYWGAPSHRIRLGLLLGASWLFYLAWYPVYLILFLAVTAFNYGAGLAIGRCRLQYPARGKWILVVAVAVNLVQLGIFKYLDFFLQSLGLIVRELFGISWEPPLFHLFLPLGISFFTFQMIAYIVDVYRGECASVSNPFRFSLFIGFFPQLIAGPIVRANELMGQLEKRRTFDASRFAHGLDLIAIGLFKKILIADQLAPFVDEVYRVPEAFGSGTLWLAVYAYSAQIYCDFSGYTDIGRGCAYCLGFQLPPNFRAPYLAANIVDFWRRWHMTLSSWLRDYLYIPLGGNRHGSRRTYINLLLTMTLGGLWHGASWNFVVWGVAHGVALGVTRYYQQNFQTPEVAGKLVRKWLSVLVTFHFVSIVWVFFRAPTFEVAVQFFSGLVKTELLTKVGVGTFGMVQLAVIVATMLLLLLGHLAAWLGRSRSLQSTLGWTVARPALYFVVFVGVTLMSERGSQQFIYFQF